MLITKYNHNFILTNIDYKNIQVSNENLINKIKLDVSDDIFFGSVVKKNSKIYIFYRKNHGFQKTKFDCETNLLVSKDGISFEVIKKSVIGNNFGSISNNICIIDDTETKGFIGLGGRHCEKIVQDKHNENNCKCKNNNYHSKIESDYQLAKHPIFYNNNRGTLPFINSNFKHECFMNGVYLLNSNNGINWELSNNYPIINGFDNGMKDKIFGATTFDSQMSLLYNKNECKYYCFCRENSGINARTIRYSSSLDLKTWNIWQRININQLEINHEKISIYNGNFFNYPKSNFFCGIVPYCDSKKTSIIMLTSKNCETWNFENILIDNEKSNIYSEFPLHGGLICSNDEKNFFLYTAHDKHLLIYSIRKDGFQCFINKKKLIGKLFSNDLLQFGNYVNINYNCYSKDSYLKLNWYSSSKNLLYSSEKMNGNDVCYKYDLNNDNIKNNNLYLEIELYECELFSIDI